MTKGQRVQKTNHKKQEAVALTVLLLVLLCVCGLFIGDWQVYRG
jgi:cytochrome oxidase assembly protein ShyY1